MEMVLITYVDDQQEEIICSSWTSWYDGSYLNFVFFDTQTSNTHHATPMMRFASRNIVGFSAAAVETIGKD